MSFKAIHDISITLGEEMPNAKGANYKAEAWDIPIGKDTFHGIRYELNGHMGTHVDAPCHMSPFKKGVDEYSLERFIVPAVVVAITNPDVILPEELKKADIKNGDAVLFKTDNSRLGRSVDPSFASNGKYGCYVFLSIEGAEYLTAKGVSMVGFDYSAGECPQEPLEGVLHRHFFERDVIIMESLNLKNVKEGRYTLIALPIKAKGVNGAPVRAVLLEE